MELDERRSIHEADGDQQNTPKAKSSSIVIWIRDQIRDAIVSGEYVGGQKLTEATLTRELAVSRAPLREALRNLERDGYVTIHPNRGAYVRLLTRADLKNLFEMRGLLESHAASRCAERCNEPAVLFIFQELQDEASKFREGQQPRPFVEHDTALHSALVQNCGNPLLAQQWYGLQMPVARFRFFAKPDMLNVQRSALEHYDLISAILKGNSRAAFHHVRHHVEMIGEIIQSLSDDDFEHVFNCPKSNG